MEVNLITQPFLIYSGNLMNYLSNQTVEKKGFRLLSAKGWGRSIISVGRIIRSIDTITPRAIFSLPGDANPSIEYEVKP